ncbi:MAG: hypothetical protein ABJK28_09330 [Algibacter sp.]
MNITQTHYYLYKGNRYDNMKECRDTHNLGRTEFRKMVKEKIIEKKIINDVNPQGDAQNKKTTKTRF